MIRSHTLPRRRHESIAERLVCPNSIIHQRVCSSLEGRVLSLSPRIFIPDFSFFFFRFLRSFAFWEGCDVREVRTRLPTHLLVTADLLHRKRCEFFFFVLSCLSYCVPKPVLMLWLSIFLHPPDSSTKKTSKEVCDVSSCILNLRPESSSGRIPALCRSYQSSCRNTSHLQQLATATALGQTTWLS